MSPAEILKLVGEALYGPRWQSDLAGDLDVNECTMRRWAAGDDLPRADVLKDLRQLVLARQAELERVDRAIMQAPIMRWRAAGPRAQDQEPQSSVRTKA